MTGLLEQEVKVRGMVEDKIARLLEEAADDVDQKPFCDEEIGKSEKSQSEKEVSLARCSRASMRMTLL